MKKILTLSAKCQNIGMLVILMEAIFIKRKEMDSFEDVFENEILLIKNNAYCIRTNEFS